MSTKVIVFGPTGNIASVAARRACEHGAKVYLAMRDPSKPIRGLSAQEEQQGGYERIQADMTQPDTVAAAVQKSGATRAYLYLAIHATDGMKSTFEALKSSGIEFVVLNSSFTIPGNPQDVKPAEIIAYIHAQAEINLEAVFGPDNYVAVRPGCFATNLLEYKSGILAGEVGAVSPDTKFDWITPDDMGRVSGTILAKGLRDQKHVYLFGPQMISQREAFQTVSQVLGKQITIKILTPEEGIEQHIAQGLPPPIAKYRVEAEPHFVISDSSHQEGVKNVERYTGGPGTSLRAWLEANKDLFEA